MFFPVVLGFLTDPLCVFFGWLMGLCYSWLNNYGLMLIFISVAVRLLLMPLSFKQQRSMAKQQFLQDDLNEIRRIYANDPQRASEAQMQLMQDSGVSMTSGCLPMLLQFLLMISMWRPIQRPLFYIAGVNMDNINCLGNYLYTEGLITEKVFQQIARTDIPLLAALRENGSALSHAVSEGWIELNQVMDLDFMGMDLGLTPTVNPKLVFGSDTWRTYLPIFIMMVLMIGCMFLSMKLNKINMPQGQKSKEEKEREKKNPAKRGQTPEQGEGMMKTMNYVFPIMMVFTAMALPAAMTLFWLLSNLMVMLQTWLTYKYYTQPMQQLLQERQAAKAVTRRNK